MQIVQQTLQRTGDKTSYQCRVVVWQNTPGVPERGRNDEDITLGAPRD